MTKKKKGRKEGNERRKPRFTMLGLGGVWVPTLDDIFQLGPNPTLLMFEKQKPSANFDAFKDVMSHTFLWLLAPSVPVQCPLEQNLGCIGEILHQFPLEISLI